MTWWPGSILYILIATLWQLRKVQHWQLRRYVVFFHVNKSAYLLYLLLLLHIYFTYCCYFYLANVPVIAISTQNMCCFHICLCYAVNLLHSDNLSTRHYWLLVCQLLPHSSPSRTQLVLKIYIWISPTNFLFCLNDVDSFLYVPLEGSPYISPFHQGWTDLRKLGIPFHPFS